MRVQPAASLLLAKDPVSAGYPLSFVGDANTLRWKHWPNLGCSPFNVSTVVIVSAPDQTMLAVGMEHDWFLHYQPWI